MNDEVEILKYVENHLTETQRIAFEQRMKSDVGLQEAVQAMQASFLPYTAAVSEYESRNDLTEVPEELRTFFDEVNGALDEQSKVNNITRFSFTGYAKIAVFAFALFFTGFLSSQFMNSGVFSQKENNFLARYDVPHELFEYMVIYQALYNRGTVDAASQTVIDRYKLLNQFNRENDLSIEVPNLNEYGYQFRRVQQLAYQGRPILQFVYLGKTGEPVAVCVTPAKTDNQDATNLSKIFAGMNTVSWGKAGSVFMLISKESEMKLNYMAENLSSI